MEKLLMLKQLNIPPTDIMYFEEYKIGKVKNPVHNGVKIQNWMDIEKSLDMINEKIDHTVNNRISQYKANNIKTNQYAFYETYRLINYDIFKKQLLLITIFKP